MTGQAQADSECQNFRNAAKINAHDIMHCTLKMNRTSISFVVTLTSLWNLGQSKGRPIFKAKASGAVYVANGYE
jgi:hypothetical protein